MIDLKPSTTDARDDVLFAEAVAIVLQHEGGLVDDPADPGGLTNRGISLRSYPELGPAGIRDLTADQARAIYRSDWWDRYFLGEMPAPVAVKMLDLAVNMGIRSATRCLQRALVAMGRPVDMDGVLGAQTRAAARGVAAGDLATALRGQAVAHYDELVRDNPKFTKFAAGWRARAMA